MDFSNREIATGILLVAGIGLFGVSSKDRRSIMKSIGQVFKALFAWKLLLLIGLYCAYAVALVSSARTLGLWDSSVLTVTLLAIVVTGFPLFMNANEYATGAVLVRKAALEVVGLSALTVTYLNLAEFPIWGELILQVLLLFMVLIVALAPRVPQGKPVARIFEILLSLIGIGLLSLTTVSVLHSPDTVDWSHELQAFVVSVWLPLALIPFMYGVSMFMAIEMALVRLPFHNKRGRPPLRVRWALILGFRGSLRYAKRFSGPWISQVATKQTFRTGWTTMREYRAAVQGRVAEQRARDRVLKARAGKRGVDDHGLWLDRREFYETRAILDDAWFTQSAIAGRTGKYVDGSFLRSSMHLCKLPKDHGIEIVLSASARAWYAWRKTPGGYYFATGGTKHTDAHWQYADSERPADFPQAAEPGWLNTTENAHAREWATERDDPIALS